MQLTEWMRAHGKTKCDILKAAHHGSKNSTLPEFLQQLTPKYAWISSESATGTDIRQRRL